MQISDKLNTVSRTCFIDNVLKIMNVILFLTYIAHCSTVKHSFHMFLALPVSDYIKHVL